MAAETHNGTNLLLVDADGPKLASEQDALDLIGLTYGTDTDVIVVPATRFKPEFFDLSTRLAGGFFQKLQTYRLRLAIVGDISSYLTRSKALRDFVSETNRIGHHLFVADRAALVAGLDRGR
jgi:hypothetical protein